MKDRFGTHGELKVGDRTFRIVRLSALEKQGWNLARLPVSLRILLENLLRNGDEGRSAAGRIEAFRDPDPAAPTEIAFTPARVLMQDFTGVPAVVDLAAMRDALARLGGDPRRINPRLPTELVIDHSVQVDAWASPDALRINAKREFERNRERYAFLRWGQRAFDNFRVVPPATGIVHQVNLEYLARVVMTSEEASVAPGETPWAYPDTLVGTDSHTTMINGLGVLGWGVGGIEAEAAMLGQPLSMLIPQVVGFRLTGRPAPGTTATDIVLTITQILREHGVVGKFVEFFGPGLASLSLADRATIANMSPEYGATCGLFPVDGVTLEYLRLTGRSPERIALVEAYMKEQGLFHTPDQPEPEYSAVVELDLGSVEPSLAGPRRPQDRVPLGEVKVSFERTLAERYGEGRGKRSVPGVTAGGETFDLEDGAVVIAAITSCTNTSNPSVMVAAGLVARKAAERGLRPKPWVKTSLAPGSQVVPAYLKEAGLLTDLERLGFHVVGYGCTTCIGNSGPLDEAVVRAIGEAELTAVSVLSGNRNFEGRISPYVRANYLASPPLVVVYALTGRIDVDLTTEPVATDRDGNPVMLRDLWPSPAEIEEVVRRTVRADLFERGYRDVFAGGPEWNAVPVDDSERYRWDPDSTYVKHPPYFEGMTADPPEPRDIRGARVLVMVGDSVTTDHISPAGAIPPDSPAGRYLRERGIPPEEFNSYGSRRGNHEVMMRGTFANIRLRNRLVPGVEGGETVHLPDGVRMSVFDAAERYREEGVPLLILAGKEYGTGSSRDWAAKGPCLLGVRAVLAESFERIHRSNLVGMGIVPLEFLPGENAGTLGLTGRERYDILGLREGAAGGFENGTVRIVATPDEGGDPVAFSARIRLDTPQEIESWRHGGILHRVLRDLAAGEEE